MKSHEVIRAAVEEPGVKAVAAALKLSPALVYKWCEPTREENVLDKSGAKNPLDRAKEMYDVTKDIRLVQWICQQADGFFVENPNAQDLKDVRRQLFSETQTIVRDFSDLLQEITAASENDSSIDRQEADRIRQHWEDLKSRVERFVLASERGLYHVTK